MDPSPPLPNFAGPVYEEVLIGFPIGNFRQKLNQNSYFGGKIWKSGKIEEVLEKIEER